MKVESTVKTTELREVKSVEALEGLLEEFKAKKTQLPEGAELTLFYAWMEITVS